MERKIKETKAKQGRTGWPILLVLVLGLILISIAWWGAEIYGEAIAPQNPVGQAAEESAR